MLTATIPFSILKIVITKVVHDSALGENDGRHCVLRPKVSAPQNHKNSNSRVLIEAGFWVFLSNEFFMAFQLPTFAVDGFMLGSN